MKKMILFGLVIMMAFILSIPAVYAQQQDTQGAKGQWQCPMIAKAGQADWTCPRLKADGQDGWQCLRQGRGGRGAGMMGRNRPVNNQNRAQPSTQQ